MYRRVNRSKFKSKYATLGTSEVQSKSSDLPTLETEVVAHLIVGLGLSTPSLTSFLTPVTSELYLLFTLLGMRYLLRDLYPACRYAC